MVSPLNHRLRRVKKLITQIVFLVFGFWFLVSPCYPQSSKYIRVAIVQDAASLSLKISGFYEIIDAHTQKVLYRDRNLKTTVTTYRDGIWIGKINSKTNKLFIKADDPGVILVDDRKFRGDIELIKKDNLHLMVINHIGLEDYIKGILYHETSHYWPMEALKAQAIVCRTYAVYEMQENNSRDYDVTSDIYSQVYGGRTSERYRTNTAVEETKGQILIYQDKPIPAYYHATCGGYTEDASLIWNIDIAPLKGRSCSFCKDSPHFNWYQVLSQDKIREALINSGYVGFKNIKDIVILGKDNSGRIIDLKIITDKKEIKISAKDFRNIIGPNVIKSTNFKVNLVNNDVIFEGFGWGHGVGLCQWGSYFMAKLGYNYKQILKYYYPGSDVKTLGF